MISDTNFGGRRVEAEAHSGLIGTIASITLVVLGVVALFAANALVWVNSSLLDSGGFSSAMNTALDKPETQQRIADVLAQRIVESPEVQQRVESELPPSLRLVARAAQPEIADGISGLILRILETDLTGNLRDTVIQRLHVTVIAVLEDRDSSIVGASNDRLVLDLSGVVSRVFDRLGIAPPARVQDPDFGQVVLTEDVTGLKQASFFVRNRTEIAVGSLVVAACLFGAAVLVDRNHRHGLLLCGYGIAAAGLLTLLLVWGGNRVLESSAEERTVISAIVDALETNLKLQSLALIVLGVSLICAFDRRILRGLDVAWDRGAGAVERFGTQRAALIAAGVLVVLLLLV
jgi:hypothetical protein